MSYSKAPSSIPSMATSMLAWPVSMITSTRGVFRLISRKVWIPLMPAIFTSRTTTSTGWATRNSRAASPLCEHETCRFLLRSRFSRVSRNSTSSSTRWTRISSTFPTSAPAGSTDLLHQFLQIARLHEIVEGPHFQSLAGGLLGAVTGEHDHRHVGDHLLENLQNLDPLHFLHLHVHY